MGGWLVGSERPALAQHFLLKTGQRSKAFQIVSKSVDSYRQQADVALTVPPKSRQVMNT